MGYFAKVLDNVVKEVIVAEPEFFDTFVDTSPGEWVQTSFNTRGGIHYGPDGQPDELPPLRKNFASIGFTYDRLRDAFIPPQNFPSWLLNEQTCQWEAPIAFPTDGNDYVWNESTQSWDLVVPPSN